jgi:hypothetical protein
VRLYPVGAPIRLLHWKLQQVGNSLVHVLKSLSHFEDAERNPILERLAPVWVAGDQSLFPP